MPRLPHAPARLPLPGLEARSVAAALIAQLVLAGSAAGIPTTFTDSAAFLAALPGPASTLDFDGETAGTTIPSGGSLDGITFSYDFGGISMMVADGADTISAPNFLGTDDGDILQDGDDFDLSFAPVNAIGLFFLTADVLFDDDIMLSAAGVSASLVAADVETTLPDGTDVYFLGIVDDAVTFTDASVTTIGEGFFLYNVDDVTTAIPEPGTSSLLALGVAALSASRQHRRS